MDAGAGAGARFTTPSPIGGVIEDSRPMMMSQGLAARDSREKDHCIEYFLLSPVFFILL